MAHMPKPEAQQLFGDTALIVSALEDALYWANEALSAGTGDSNKRDEYQALLTELKSGHKILSPWCIDDAYAQVDEDDDVQLSEEEAIKALSQFGDNDYYIEQGNEAMADIVRDIISEREQ